MSPQDGQKPDLSNSGQVQGVVKGRAGAQNIERAENLGCKGAQQGYETGDDSGFVVLSLYQRSREGGIGTGSNGNDAWWTHICRSPAERLI